MKKLAIVMMALLVVTLLAGCMRGAQQYDNTQGTPATGGDQQTSGNGAAATGDATAVDEGTDFVSEDDVDVGSVY